MDTVTSEPPAGTPTLPIAVRGVMRRDPKKRKIESEPEPTPAQAGPGEKPRPKFDRPKRSFLIADPPADSPLAGVALCGRTRDWRVSHEILVYGDGASGEAIAELERRAAAACRPGARVSVFSLDDFRRRFIIASRQYRNLGVSYDLPSALAQIARRWAAVEGRGRFVKGWALEMLPPGEVPAAREKPSAPAVEPAPARAADTSPKKKKRKPPARGPSVFVKILPGGARMIALRNCKGGGGGFLDLSRLAYALSAKERPFEAALTAFTGEVFEAAGDPVEHHRRRARAILSLAETLIGIFDLSSASRARRGGSLAETAVQSPAGMTRALARTIGFAAPEVPPNRLGMCAAAFYGGRIEARYRGEAPTATVDFSKTYPMIAALVGLQRFLSTERIAFEDCLEEARRIAGGASVAAMLDPALWPQLAVLCRVHPQGEPLPVSLRDERSGDIRNATPYRWSDGGAWLFLPDVIAAKLSPDGPGRAPEIIEAWRMVPAGERRKLRGIRFASGFAFDPARHDIFCALVEEGERLRRGDGRWKDVPRPVREICLYPAWKAGNNGFAFGDLARCDVEDLPGKSVEEVTLVHDEGELRVETNEPEDPGPFFCMPLAGLVTSGARLLLTLVDALVAERGGTVAAGHTDSAHIIATEEGGTIECEAVSDPYEGRGGYEIRQISLHALSRADVEEICAAFRPLNLFDPALMPGSPLKIERMG